MTLFDGDCKQINAKDANLLSEKEQYEVEEVGESNFRKMVKGLKETDKNYFGMCCVTYGHADKIPKSLQSRVGGNCGIFKKLDSNRQVKKTRRAAKSTLITQCISCA